MALQKIERISGRAVHVPGSDLDTDQIVPARFLKCVTFEGLGESLFRDLRFDQQGRSLNHPLDRPENAGATILVSGANFGCGSSREHAPQALFHFGIRAVIAESFAEIFFGNCTTLGIPCVSLAKADREALARQVEAHQPVDIDLTTKKIRCGDQTYGFEVPENARRALTGGAWDPLAELLEGLPLAKSLSATL
jgi:3-isopropylmalate/(R)-2-methylmalate dehydratase small subunit